MISRQCWWRDCRLGSVCVQRMSECDGITTERKEIFENAATKWMGLSDISVRETTEDVALISDEIFSTANANHGKTRMWEREGHVMEKLKEGDTQSKTVEHNWRWTQSKTVDCSLEWDSFRIKTNEIYLPRQANTTARERRNRIRGVEQTEWRCEAEAHNIRILQMVHRRGE